MRVGAFFLACMMLGAFAGIAYGIESVVSAWSAYSSSRTAAWELVAFQEVFRIPETVAAERVVAVGQLSAPGVAGEKEREALATARKATDDAFTAGLEAMALAGEGGARTDRIKGAQARIGSMRDDVDRMVKLPRPERPADAMTSRLNPAQTAYTEINRLLTSVQSDASLQDAVIQDALDLSRLAYALRQWAAQRGTALIAAISSGKPMNPATFETLATAEGHLDEIWSQISVSQETRTFSPAIAAGIATIQSRYFGDNAALYAKVVAAGRGTGTYPALDDFRRDHAPGVAAPFALRNAALATATDRAAQLTRLALGKLWLTLGLLAVVCGVIVGATWWFRRRVVGALGQLTAVVTALAGRDHTVEVPFQTRRDEVGQMAVAIERLRQDDIAFGSLTERAAQEQAAREGRAARVDALCMDFHAETRTTIDMALQSAASMRIGASNSTRLVQDVEKRTLSVAATTGQAANDVRAIVASSAQLGESIGGLVDQVNVSSRIVAQAEGAVGEASSRMEDLVAATGKIGAVTSLIQKIAAQTNLLALNATIEAARAGDAGKGFAVVAGEVKALANQTARATDDIAGQIALVQEATTGVGSTIREISGTIAEINRLGQTVAAAVDQQKRATADIGTHVHETAGGIEAVAADIHDVQDVAAQTGAAATEMTATVMRLTNDAERLTEQISTFLERVRAA